MFDNIVDKAFVDITEAGFVFIEDGNKEDFDASGFWMFLHCSSEAGRGTCSPRRWSGSTSGRLSDWSSLVQGS